MNLIIVESPTKAKTLSRFLKGAYQVTASMGHIRDLPKSELGVDVNDGFQPKYVIPTAKKKTITELRKMAEKSDVVILATDPDREGEAIAWHIQEILTKKAESGRRNAEKTRKKIRPPTSDFRPRFSRITFHEITESAIRHALEHPGAVDMKLVDAQQARRILDRLVGYSLSPLLWKKLSKRWLSAGRVQSVAVRLIVEREREISRFAKEQYFSIDATFASQKHNAIVIPLISHQGKKYEETLVFELFDGKYTTTKTSIGSQKQAETIIHDFQSPYTVTALETKEVHRSPNAPYTTSTLQQDAGRKLYFSSKKTMQLAQKMYEEGIITYHRTDSVNLSEKFIDEANRYITATFGKLYAISEARHFKTKSKVAQEAHEAIRPTNVAKRPDDLRGYDELNHDHIRLYELIWKRAVATQMSDAVFDSTTITVDSANAYEFETTGSVIKFDGFLKVTGYDNGEVVIPKCAVGEQLKLTSATPVLHETQPPPRYTEASLVKTLEEKDIGRPSTYAPIISTIIERQYVKKEEKKLVPTELGGLVTDFLVKYFAEIVSLPFTATLEGNLDAIANGDRPWQPVLSDFYTPFQADITTAYETAEKVKMSEEQLDEKCPSCGGQLVIRTGRYGKFVACSNFPTCKYTRQHNETIDKQCPKCGGAIVVRKSRRGKTFYGCSNYPTCTFAAWRKEDIK